jgi:hypothetical protein
MAGHADFDAILSTTLKLYGNKLVDNVFNDTPLLDFLQSKGRIRMESGGESIVTQLLYDDNSTFGSYAGYDPLDITAQEGITAAVYPWKQAAASIAISGAEEAKNRGKSQLINLLKAKITQAEGSAAAGLTTMLFADGTGNSSKDFDGLRKLVTATGTVGGIDATATGNDFWQSVVVAAGTAGTTERDDAEWTNAFYTASKGNDAPDFLITTQDLFEHYEAGLVSQLRFTSNEKADSRFQTLEFKGRKLYFDLACPSGYTYGLNSKYLELVGMEGRWFKPTPFRETPDVDARWAQLLLMGNLVTSNRSRHFVITGQTVV